MWPRTSELEKIAKDNGRTWTGPNSQNLTENFKIDVAFIVQGRLSDAR